MTNSLVHPGRYKIFLDDPLYILRGHRLQFSNSIEFLSLKTVLIVQAKSVDTILPAMSMLWDQILNF